MEFKLRAERPLSPAFNAGLRWRQNFVASATLVITWLTPREGPALKTQLDNLHYATKQ